MTLPKFAQVNGSLQSGYYEIQDGDAIEMLNFYTVAQILEFMDILLPEDTPFAVNHVAAGRNTPVYENFSLDWGEKALVFYTQQAETDSVENTDEEDYLAEGEDIVEEEVIAEKEEIAEAAEKPAPHDISVIVNGSPVRMSGKSSYVYVDVFDYIDFDLSKPHGSSVYTGLNGEKAEYLREIKDGDVFEIYWNP